jgi:hypothetical protein
MVSPTQSIETFNKEAFVAELADSMKLAASQVVITSVAPGSVIVDFHIQPAGTVTTFTLDEETYFSTTLTTNANLVSEFGEYEVTDVQTPTQAIAAASPPPLILLTPPPAEDTGGGGSSAEVGMIVGIACAGGALVVFIGGFLWRRNALKVRPREASAAPAITQGEP